MLVGLALGLGAVGVATAPPAAAIDDPTLPDARVTNGPSCRPGGLVVEVTAGTVAYEVRLATTRGPGGEAEAVLQPGQVVVLSTGDVDPGETIDGRLEYTALDGSGTSYVDELAAYTFTRPTAEECEKATAAPSSPSAPTSPPAPEPGAEPTPPAEPSSTPDRTPTTSPPRPTSTPAPTPSTPSTPTTPETTAPGSTAPGPTAPGSTAPTAPSRPPAPSASPATSTAPVPAGGTVRVHVDGYRPGELVTFALDGSDEVLSSATADDDGAVVAEVLIPAWTASGPVSLAAVGTSSDAVAAVPLEVATAGEGSTGDDTPLVPLLVAAGALAVTGAGLVSATVRRRAGRR